MRTLTTVHNNRKYITTTNVLRFKTPIKYKNLKDRGIVYSKIKGLTKPKLSHLREVMYAQKIAPTDCIREKDFIHKLHTLRVLGSRLTTRFP